MPRLQASPTSRGVMHNLLFPITLQELDSTSCSLFQPWPLLCISLLFLTHMLILFGGLTIIIFSLYIFLSLICWQQKGYAKMGTHWDILTEVRQIPSLSKDPGKPSALLLPPPLHTHTCVHTYKDGHISQELILKPSTVRLRPAFPVHVPLSSTPSSACCFPQQARPCVASYYLTLPPF